MHLSARFTSLVDAYPRLLWMLGIGSFLHSVGFAFIWPLTTIYIHDHMGQSMTAAGVVLLFHSAGAALGQLAGGWLTDRIGARRVILTGLTLSALLMVVLGRYESWPVYVAVMIAFGITSSLAGPAINALVALAWPNGGRRAFNFNYVAHNLGVAVGTVVGGLLADISFSVAFYGAAILFGLFVIFAFVAIRPAGAEPHRDPRAVGAGPAQGDGGGLAGTTPAAPEWPVPWLPVVALFVAYLTVWLVYMQWPVGVSVHMQALGFDLSVYSLLWTLNGALIVVGQPLLSWVLRRVRRAAAQMVLGLALIAAALALLLTSSRYGVFVGSMVLLTFGEMLLWPVIPASVARLSPPSRRGTLQGFILSGATFGRMLGPLLGGMLYDASGFNVQIAVMSAGLVVPLLAVLLFDRTRPAMVPAEGD